MTAEPFDFRTPPAVRSGGAAHEWLSTACRVAARGPLALDLRLARVEPTLPVDFFRTLPDSALGFALELAGRPAFLTLGRPLLLVLLAGLFGEPAASLPEDRALTAVEWDLVDYLMSQLLEPLSAAWPSSESVELKVVAIGAPRTTCRLPADATALAGKLMLHGPYGAEPLVLLMPPAALPDAESPQAARSFDRPELEAALREMPLEFSVELGRAVLTLGQLAAIKHGDVLLLDQQIGEPLRASVGGAERFEVWAGARGRSQAVRIHANAYPADG